jgi:hypothetical protein
MVQDIVEQFFPATVTKSTAITKINAYAFMNDFTYVRFVWMKRNPGMFFDYNNLTLRYQLLDIYLEFGLTSWTTDTVVNTLLKKS